MNEGIGLPGCIKFSRDPMRAAMSNQTTNAQNHYHMKPILRALEDWFNRINDWDGTWIGFRRLKPAPSDDMPVRTVAVLSLFYAPVTAICVAGIGLLGSWPSELITIGSVAAAVCFVLLQSLSALFWNRRASKLRISR